MYPGYYIEGKYIWTAEACAASHRYCERRFLESLRFQYNIIVVDNTNIVYRDMKYYLQESQPYDCDIEVHEIVPKTALLSHFIII